MNTHSTSVSPILCIAGQNALAVQGLQAVVTRYPQAQVYCVPTPADQGVDTWQPSLRKKAAELGVKCITLEQSYALQPLVFISLQFTQIIKTAKFASARLYNLHFSKLPHYKGVYPAVHPILNGETQAGVTLHVMDDGIDTGDIIAQSTLEIAFTDTARDLYLKQAALALTLLETHLDAMVTGQYVATPQPAVGASYYSKTSIDYGHVQFDFNKTAYQVHNQIRAFTFREYQMPMYQSWSILRSEITAQKSTQKAGTVVAETEAYIELASVDYNVRLYKDYYPLLWAACQTGDQAQVLTALPYIADLELRNKQGWNALIIAAYHGHLALVQLLLARGVNVNSTNYKGTTALMYALSHYQLHQRDDVFAYLAKQGSDTTQRDMHGKTIRDYIHEKGLTALLSHLSDSLISNTP